jgi:DNA-binding MarR family transcriptional regulator
MDLARSTLSEALSKLETFGYLEQAPRDRRDRRHIGIVLTRKGVDAVRRTSVLESQRLQAALSRLSSSDLSAVIAGLETLARACRRGRSKSAG